MRVSRWLSARELQLRKQAVAIIGTGTIGSMLLRASARFAPGRFLLLASNTRPEPLQGLMANVPGLQTGKAGEIASSADIVIVCVQPQRYLAAIDDIAPSLRAGTILVSVTNGASLEAIAARTSAPIVKVVPSVAHAIGRGIALVTKGPRASATDVEAVRRFFEPFSRPIEISSEDNRIATNITGCGPALLSSFCQELVRANADRAVSIDAETIGTMMKETFAATAALIETGSEFAKITAEAATNGGMTQAALDVLSGGLPELLGRMVDATFERERKLQATQ